MFTEEYIQKRQHQSIFYMYIRSVLIYPPWAYQPFDDENKHVINIWERQIISL